MLVYGDATRRDAPGESLARLRAAMAAAGTMPAGLARHAALAGLLIEAGELAQGLLDERLAADGAERPSRLAAALGRLTLALAASLQASFAGCSADGCERSDPDLRTGLRRARRALDRLACLALPDEIDVKIPEGYAIDVLDPELNLAAAARLERPAGEALTVLGIRSIGTSLGAAVAAALGAAPPITLRPAGHPFARRLDLSPALARRLLAGGGRYAVVDEGPGLSGSSFGAVADWLEEGGVPAERILFFPGHAGDPGPMASGRHRARWARARRLTASFDDLFLDAGSPRHIARWADDGLGRVSAPPEELSGGRWRERLFARQDDWPPVFPQQERRKLLLATGRGLFLLKFVGLGRYGDEAHERARTLAAAGFGPPVAGFLHGFLAGSWLAGAKPLPVAEDVDRRALLEQVARYLAFVSRRFPAPPGTSGASPTRLLEMARHNAAAALGSETAEGLRSFEPLLPDLARRNRPICGDHKLQAWEWLVTPDGRLVKADGLDHWRGHDLVGAQDAAWDLAGAIEELDLDPKEAEILCGRLREHGVGKVTPPELRFYRTVYLAFQLGRQTIARESVLGSDVREAGRLERSAARYGERLRERLAALAV